MKRPWQVALVLSILLAAAVGLMGPASSAQGAGAGGVEGAVFFDAKQGELVGPLRSVRGHWLARVKQRHAAKRGFDVTDARQEALVREVLVRRLFLEWVDGVVGRAVVRVPAAAGK